MSVLWKSRTLIRSTAAEAMMNCSGTVPKSLFRLPRRLFQPVFQRNDNEEVCRRGEREIYLEYRQKGMDEEYHWISSHLIYVDNPVNGDMIAIRMIKVLMPKVGGDGEAGTAS